jgi:serine phosphatase RsbU (regulator of sigma subunit)/CHASE3 domain sensor protein
MARRRDSLRTSLRGRLGAVLLVIVGFVGLSALVSGLSIKVWSATLDDRGEARNAARDVSDLKLAYSDQETGVRGYQIAPADDALTPYRDGSALARQMLDRLHARRLDQLDLTSYLAAVERSADQWRSTVAEPTIDDPQAAPTAAVATARFDQLRNDLDALDTAVTAELDRLLDRTDMVRATTFAVVIGSFVATLFVVIAVAMLFRRWVLSPLASISSSARRLGDDDTVELPDYGITELQDVTDAIRSMQASLAEARDRAVTAYEGLAQSAVLALHVRSQLSNELGELPAGWDVESMLEPATGVVAGDCYDLGLVDPHTLYIVIVDVTGHGAVAALDALKAKSQLRAALRSRLEPGAAIEWLARERSGDPEADFMTTAVVLVDIETGACRYASGGHPPMLIVGNGSPVPLDPTGPLVGAFTATWATHAAQIGPGQALVVYTDGVTDTIGAERERFGDARMIDALDGVRHGAGAAVDALRTAVEEFRVGPRYDDLSVVVLARPAQPAVEGASPGPIARMPA